MPAAVLGYARGIESQLCGMKLMVKRSRTKSVTPNADRIDILRILAGLTWCELAQAAGVSAKVRTKLAAGRFVSVKSLRAVAKALDVKFAEVVELPEQQETADTAAAPEMRAVG